MADFLEGEIILIDKPFKWTSFDVIKKIKGQLRGITGERKIKIGHAGTLDPLATGLLIACTGKKTKTIAEIQAMGKEYEGVIQLGAITPSYDLETEPEKFKSIDQLDEDTVLNAVGKFIGEIEQRPPIYSAVKIKGKRAYDYARKGQEVEIKRKKVVIKAFDITGLNLPELQFRVECSKGTYIRSLAHDLGQELGVGAYLKSLKRTSIGNYKLKDAISMEHIESYLKNQAET